MCFAKNILKLGAYLKNEFSNRDSGIVNNEYGFFTVTALKA
jgi:hypothetical protein